MNSKSALSAFGRGRQTPLVGRNAELEVVRRVLAVGEAGLKARIVGSQKLSSLPLDTLRSPQCMVLVGETGIGKTRLAEEVSREAEERGWVVVWSRNYAQESSIPYRQWIEVLRGIADAGLWQEQDLQAHPVISTRLAAMLPELYPRLPRASAPLRRSPEQEQQSLWEAVLELFKTVCGRKPLLVVLDDIQWADASSCELLAYLARRLADLPLAFLATCRETELPPRHPLRQLIAHMKREHSIQTLPIQPLTDTQISTMVAYLPAMTVHYIQAQAAGNPFFAEELAHSLHSFSTNAPIASSDKQPRVRKHHSSLPDTIAAALHHRVSRLSKDCQQLLSNAAILGGSFEFALLCSMEAHNTPATDEDTVLDLLDEALQAGVLVEEGRGVRITYRFWHPLLGSHLYEGLSATRRALLHRRAAQILRQAYATRLASLSLPLPTNIAREQTEEGAATIVYHLVEGGESAEQVVYYATLAANYAYGLSAYPEAERYYRVAVEHAGAARTGSEGTQHERVQLAFLLEQLGECIRIQGNAEEARQVYEQALHERSTPERSARLPQDVGEEREVQVDALLWGEIGWTWYATNDYSHARECCARGEQVLREAGVSGGPAWARLSFLESYISWQQGHYEEASSTGYEALRLFEAYLSSRPSSGSDTAHLSRLRRTLEGDPVDVARTHRLLGSLAYSTGQPNVALTHLNQALVLLEQHNHQREIAHVCCNVGHIHVQKAEHELAQTFLRRSLTLAERIGDIPLTAVVFSNLGELATSSGNLTEAENWYKRSLELAEQIGDSVYLSTWNVALASVLQDQERLPEAMACIHRSLSIGRAIDNIPCIGLALVALGNVRLFQAQAQINATRRGSDNAGRRFLARARATLQRALALQGLEAETRVKGQLALAHVFLLLGELETAQAQAAQTLEEASRSESVRLLACTQRLLGRILAAQGQVAEAAHYFQQALQLLQQSGMHLEYARTLQSYSMTIQPTNPPQARIPKEEDS